MHLHHGVMAISITKAASKNRPVPVSPNIAVDPIFFRRIMEALRYPFIRRLAVYAWLFGGHAEICLYKLPVVLSIVKFFISACILIIPAVTRLKHIEVE